MKLFKRFKQKLTEPFATVDWREFKIGIIVYLCFFTLIAVAFVLSDMWGFGIELILFYVGGFFVSIVFNLINPNNHKN